MPNFDLTYPNHSLPIFYKLSEYKQICFLHIPKTAGTTIEYLLTNLLGTEDVLIIPWTKFISPVGINLNEHKVISGHFYYEIYKLFEKKPAFITFLRNPIYRSVSQYYQELGTRGGHPFLHQASNLEHDRLKNLEMSIDEYMDSVNLQSSIMNLQTTILGWHIEAPVQTLQDLMRPMDRSDQVSLELAKDRIDSLEFIGITERMSESISLMAYTFGFPPIMSVPNLNVTPKRLKIPKLTPNQFQKLSRLNRLDLDLYDYAQMLFELRCEKMKLDLTTRYGNITPALSIEEMLERDYWQTYIDKNSELLKAIKYDFREPFPHAGWYDVEMVNCQQWVWSGPENKSFIDLPLDRTGELQISFMVRYCISTAILDSLTLSVDDNIVPLNSFKEVNGTTIYNGTIKPVVKDKQNIASRLLFCVDHTEYPAGVDSNTLDRRLLGVAVSWIEIFSKA